MYDKNNARDSKDQNKNNDSDRVSQAPTSGSNMKNAEDAVHQTKDASSPKKRRETSKTGYGGRERVTDASGEEE